MTQDFWDEWTDADGPNGYPTGLRSKLDKAVEFASFFGRNGTYADLDMLPLGDIYHMAQGPFGPSNLTHDEQVRMFERFSIASLATLAVFFFIAAHGRHSMVRDWGAAHFWRPPPVAH